MNAWGCKPYKGFYFSFQLFLKHNTLSVGAVLYAILFTKVVQNLIHISFFKIPKLLFSFKWVAPKVL